MNSTKARPSLTGSAAPSRRRRPAAVGPGPGGGAVGTGGGPGGTGGAATAFLRPRRDGAGGETGPRGAGDALVVFLAALVTMRLLAPRTGERGAKIQPTPGTGLPPMSRPSSKSHG